MKRKICPLKLLALSILFLSPLACRNELLASGDVKAITLAWVPNRELRRARMEINLDQALTKIFAEKLRASLEIDPVWITKLILIEGSYEVTVATKDGGSDCYQFGGDSILYSPTTKKYYQNKDLHLFIYQIIFRECVKRGIKLQ